MDPIKQEAISMMMVNLHERTNKIHKLKNRNIDLESKIRTLETENTRLRLIGGRLETEKTMLENSLNKCMKTLEKAMEYVDKIKNSDKGDK